MHEILHILEHAFIDTLKVLPSLFLIYLLIEYLEHKNNNKAHHLFMKSEKAGPLFGGLFGCIPQCGFSVIASELYSKRFISLGTLIAVFIATSDEAIPMLLSEPSLWTKMLMLIAAKFIFAVLFGFLIDLFIRKKQHVHHHHCEE
ncbi:MAG: arsenic efflux protein, partial [Clostridia bacterium]|nr:arsenic efflux protein [Clostridia bacterium]